MKKKIAEEWVARLRSGEYPKGKYSLDHKGRYCCLGVLCTMALEAGEVECSLDKMGVRYGEEGASGYLPKEVKEWAGMWNSKGKLKTLPSAPCYDLASLNDTTESFDEVIKVVEKHWREL